MKSPLLLAIFIALSTSFSFSQREIIRTSANYFNKPMKELNAWADENGYLAIDLKYYAVGEPTHIIRLFHREKGEITSFSGKFSASKYYGHTSNEKEFSIYFEGSYNQMSGKYAITLSKENKLPRIEEFDKDKVLNGHLVIYSHQNKMYVLEKERIGFTLTEFADPMHHRVIVKNEKSNFFSSIKPDELQVINTGGKSAQSNPNNVKLYPFTDSLLVSVEFKDKKVDRVVTQIMTVNFSNGKTSFKTVEHQIGSKTDKVSSLLLTDRFYQLRFREKELTLGVFEFPSLKSLNEFAFNESLPFLIKTSSLVNQNGDSTRKAERGMTDMQIINTLTDGIPYLSVHNSSSNQRVLQFQSSLTKTWGAGTPGSNYASVEFKYYVTTCIEKDKSPCAEPQPTSIYHLLNKQAENLKMNENGDKEFTLETDEAVYNAYFKNKTSQLMVFEVVK